MLWQRSIYPPYFYDYYRSRIDVRHGRRDTHFHQLVAGKRKLQILILPSRSSLVFISLVMTLLLTIFPHKIATLFGSDEYLMDMVVEYLFWFSISLPFTVLEVALPFYPADESQDIHVGNAGCYRCEYYSRLFVLFLFSNGDCSGQRLQQI